jgi:hypothetical protein
MVSIGQWVNRLLRRSRRRIDRIRVLPLTYPLRHPLAEAVGPPDANAVGGQIGFSINYIAFALRLVFLNINIGRLYMTEQKITAALCSCRPVHRYECSCSDPRQRRAIKLKYAIKF